jgi:spermidine synthase
MPSSAPAAVRDRTAVHLGIAAALEAPLLHAFHGERTGRAIEVRGHPRLGRVLLVDGRIAEVEADPSVREMLAHVPACALARPPRRALLVGGAEGLLAEVLRVPGIEGVVLLEEDDALVEAARALGQAAALDDPRVEARVGRIHASDIAMDVSLRGPYDMALLAARAARPAPDCAPTPAALAAGIAAAVAPGGCVAWVEPLILTRRGARRLSSYSGARPSLSRLLGPPAPALEHAARWFSHSPFAPGGFHLFEATSATPLVLGAPRRPFEGEHYTPEVHRAAFALPPLLRELPQYEDPSTVSAAHRTDGARWILAPPVEPGLAQGLRVRTVHLETSAEPSVEVVDQSLLGRMVLVGGALVLTEADGAIYREMATHPALLGRPRDSARVLVVGGGDGGVAHEALRHPFVRAVVAAEGDSRVAYVSRRYMDLEEEVADSRLTRIRGDGLSVLRDAARGGDRYDVVVIDAPRDASLRTPALYDDIAACLAEDGVAVDARLVPVVGPATGAVAGGRGSLEAVRPGRFARIERYGAGLSLAPGGRLEFLLLEKGGPSLREPALERSYAWYDPSVHRAAFALPRRSGA